MNNKGMSLIELIVGFALASAVTVSMFNFVTNYSNEEENERKSNEITTYKNIITKKIQTDIIKYELKSVEQNPLPYTRRNGDGSSYTEYNFILRFNKNMDEVGGPLVYSKLLTIRTSSDSIEDNYIEYPDINYNGVSQKVRYDIPNVKCTGADCNETIYKNSSKKCTGSESDSPDCVSLDFTWISSVNTNIYGANNVIDNTTNTNLGTNYFNLDITITAPENIENSHILILAPINYKYCKEVY